MTCDRLAPGNVEMLYEKSDFISVSASSKTFPLPAVPILAWENRKRFVLIGVKRAVGSLADVLFRQSELSHERRQRQDLFGSIDLRPQLGIVRVIQLKMTHCDTAFRSELILSAAPDAPCAPPWPVEKLASEIAV